MNPPRPPALAAWILQHLTPRGDFGHEAGALAGDLLEEYKCGRSAAWFWRQALAAVAIAWYRRFRASRAAVAFAALWSMLAPAWVMLVGRIVSQTLDSTHIASIAWPWSSLFPLAESIALNLAFVWAGVLVFRSSQLARDRKFDSRMLWRSLLLTLTVFNVAYIAGFGVMTLVAHPSSSADPRTVSALSEVTDIRLWAVVVRIQFFLTLLAALRTTAATTTRVLQRAGAFSAAPSPSAESGSVERPDSTEVFSTRLVISGTIGAVIVECLLCCLPLDRVVSSIGLVPAAFLYLIEAIAAGALASVVVGMPAAFRSWGRFASVALALGPAWVWIAPAFILGSRNSAWSLPLTGTAAAALALGLHRLSSNSSALQLDNGESLADLRGELFAATLQQPRRDWHAVPIAVCLYGAFIALQADALLLSCAFAAGSAYIFASQWANARPAYPPLKRDRGSAMRRLVGAALPALLITMIAMLAAIRSNRDGGDGDVAGASHHAPGEESAAKSRAADARGNGFDGYESVILWPDPPKKEILAPISLFNPPAPDFMKRRQIIRFDGSYWYFQAPASQPGAHSHIARGDPLKVNIHASNFRPITMEADQPLALPVRIAHCGAIEVRIANRDNQPGTISIGVILTDKAAPHRPTANLGARPIPSTLPGEFHIKFSPVEETLRFQIPDHARIRQFDEITFIVNQASDRSPSGARIAIEELQLLPR